MNGCDIHREYLGALADGELSLVPAATVEHVRGCAACGREVETHERLSAVLRSALASHRPVLTATPHVRRPRPTLVAGIGLVAVAAAGIAVAVARLAGGTAPDPVALALASSQRPAQFQSASAADVSAWCARAAGRPMPVIALDPLTVVGARSDRVGSLEVITVDYRTAAGKLVTVGWMEGATSPTAISIQQTSMTGPEGLVVSMPADEAVVSGNAPMPALWQAAALLQAAG
ncbi:MAG TPA: zf-HC2 domain-containing protein [Candidatus Saccharimonadales bacterium]|nr:zf-HC2 domain-containing protein [Candidatus Saccharimonadales bacterium]